MSVVLGLKFWKALAKASEPKKVPRKKRKKR